MGAQLWCRVLWCTLFAGTWLLVDLACCETQVQRVQYFNLRRSDVDDDGASCDLTSTRPIHTLRAQVAAESGLADAVRAINILATAQVRKDTPSLTDVKGIHWP